MIHIVSRTGFVLAVLCTMLSCNQQPSGSPSADAGMAAFNKDTLAADIKTLASDDFQGRRPFTPGETKTIDYLVNAYTGLRLEPGNGSSFTQDVPLVEISPAAPSTMELHSNKATLRLQNLT